MNVGGLSNPLDYFWTARRLFQKKIMFYMDLGKIDQAQSKFASAAISDKLIQWMSEI